MTDIELAVRKSRTLEARLKQEQGAKGDGLGALTKSVQGKLPPETIKQLNNVTHMRNELVHQKGQYRLKDKRDFVQQCKEIEKVLDESWKPKQRQETIRIILGMIIVLSMTAAFILYVVS